jgi:hypothetical protein
VTHASLSQVIAVEEIADSSPGAAGATGAATGAERAFRGRVGVPVPRTYDSDRTSGDPEPPVGEAFFVSDDYDEDIAGLNIPTGIPLRYDLTEDLKPVTAGGTYLDPDAAKEAAVAVANQGR